VSTAGSRRGVVGKPDCNQRLVVEDSNV
jgi:hypothetical protein